MASELEQIKEQMSALQKRVHELEGEQEPAQELVKKAKAAKSSPKPQPRPDPKPKKSVPQKPPTNPATVLAWIGGIILAIGCMFFVAYAFDQGWVSRTMQVVLGVVLGAALTVGGYWMHKKAPLQASLVMGGGIAIAYFSVYAGYAVEAYRAATGMTLAVTSVLLLLVLAAGVIVSLKKHSSVLFLESLLLAHISTLLGGITWLTIMYLLLIVAVYAFIIYRFNWEAVGWYSGAIAALFALITIARTQYYEGLVLVLGLFVIFTLLSIGRKNELAGTLTLIGSYMASVFVLRMHAVDPTFFTLGAAILAALLHMYWLSSKSEGVGSLLTAIGLLAMWVPMQFSGYIITITWSVLAGIACVLGAHHKKRWMRYAGNAVLALAAIKTLVWDAINLQGATQVWVFLVLAFVSLVIYYFYQKSQVNESLYPFVISLVAVCLLTLLQNPDELVTLIFSVLGVALFGWFMQAKHKHLRVSSIALIALAAIHLLFVDSWQLTGSAQIVVYALFAAILLGLSFYLNKQQFYESKVYFYGFAATLALLISLQAETAVQGLLYALLATGCAALGLRTKKIEHTLTGVLLFVLTFLHLVFYLSWTGAVTSTARIFGFVGVSVLLLAMSYYYGVADRFEAHIYYIGAAILLALIAPIELSKLGITVAWAALGVISLTLGLRVERPVPKNTGFVLIILSVLKLFLIDTLTLSSGLRVVAYLVLGVLILSVSIFYSRKLAKEHKT